MPTFLKPRVVSILFQEEEEEEEQWKGDILMSMMLPLVPWSLYPCSSMSTTGEVVTSTSTAHPQLFASNKQSIISFFSQ